MFKDELQIYRAAGAETLVPRLPSMVKRAADSQASLDYMYFVADVCMDRGALEEAEAILRGAAARFGENDLILNLLAFCAWERGAEDKALDAYTRSIEHNPKNVSSLRGACFLAIEKDHPHAIDYCRGFYEESGQTHESAVWYATALHNAGRKAALAQIVKEWQERFGPDQELEDFVSNS